MLQAAWLYMRVHGELPLADDTITLASNLALVKECAERVVIWRNKTEPEHGSASPANWHAVLQRLAGEKDRKCPVRKHKGHSWSKCPDIKGRLRALLALCK